MVNFFFKIKKVEVEEKNDSQNNVLEQQKLFPRIIFDIKSIKNDENNSSICCWNCTRNFTRQPIGIPYKLLNDVYYLKGYFCSFKCANTYNYYSTSENKWICESLLLSLYFQFGNKKIPIGMAPPKEILIKYGGTITENEYDELLDGNYVVNIQYPPIISLVPSITISSSKEIDKSAIIINREINDIINESENKNTELRFSINKRLIVVDNQ